MSAEKNDTYYQHLLQRWQQQKCTPTEATELMEYLRRDVSNRTLLNEIQAAFREVKPEMTPVSSDHGDRVRNKLLKHIKATDPGNTAVKGLFNHGGSAPRGIIREYRAPGSKWRIAAAAAILLGMAIPAGYLLLQRRQTPAPVATVAAKTDTTPGKTKTVLTLANGEKIVLDEKGMQQLAQQGNTVVRNKNGQLVYEKTGAESNVPLYNTLTTAAGETYPLVLADGSKIWLNAGSSIRFPATFAGNERKIELTGEAYFQIAHDAHRPFRVLVRQITVDVLGTEFNINSYADEATVNTTLLEGAVKINSDKGTMQLAPGEQSQWTPGGNLKRVTGVNTEEITAWKEGYFRFESTDLTTVLRQFSHWYDVEIIYEGKVKPRKFFGMISRKSSLVNVLKMLNANDVSYRLEGKKLIVLGE
ncbi:FecR family protein [Chitinophaga sp. 22321]|uniref:FecR domain-containing protein n=1 Tax=Chitinophaga hostae TaxID=2831022 RepID=A0ABS5J8N1_9BACT|nr:FecR family protein [Chitinophaga hostae]MBS0031571.1 FecR domain-containing protein [Chitinophaga hostae]